MRTLILGSGGREHALAWKLAQSAGVEVFASPGNPGIAREGTCLPAPDSFAQLAEHLHADLTVVGPEAPLVSGVVDEFRARGLRIVGPDREAARLEGSKVFAKSFFVQSKIPTAAFITVDNAVDARRAIARFGCPVVLKADGLAAGKGVVVAQNQDEADQALATLHWPLVIEEFLRGTEVSFIALCDGRDVVPLAATQDHKAAFMHITVKPAAHLDRLEDVLVLLTRQDLDMKKDTSANTAPLPGPPTAAAKASPSTQQ